METRTFYKPLMKTGDKGSFQIGIPKEIIDGLSLMDRDEVEVVIRKTGRSVAKRVNNFKKKINLDVAYPEVV